MKICWGCKKEKDNSEFYKNSRTVDGLQPRCKICMRSAYTSTRAKKRDHYNEVRNKRIRKLKEEYRAWKRSVGCAFCSENEPCCLEPHHLDPSEKDTDPSNLLGYSKKRLIAELNKCILVCRNCHSKIHEGLITVTESDLNIDTGISTVW